MGEAVAFYFSNLTSPRKSWQWECNRERARIQIKLSQEWQSPFTGKVLTKSNPVDFSSSVFPTHILSKSLQCIFIFPILQCRYFLHVYRLAIRSLHIQFPNPLLPQHPLSLHNRQFWNCWRMALIIMITMF